MVRLSCLWLLALAWLLAPYPSSCTFNAVKPFFSRVANAFSGAFVSKAVTTNNNNVAINPRRPPHNLASHMESDTDSLDSTDDEDEDHGEIAEVDKRFGKTTFRSLLLGSAASVAFAATIRSMGAPPNYVLPIQIVLSVIATGLTLHAYKGRRHQDLAAMGLILICSAVVAYDIFQHRLSTPKKKHRFFFTITMMKTSVLGVITMLLSAVLWGASGSLLCIVPAILGIHLLLGGVTMGIAWTIVELSGMGTSAIWRIIKRLWAMLHFTT